MASPRASVPCTPPRPTHPISTVVHHPSGSAGFLRLALRLCFNLPPLWLRWAPPFFPGPLLSLLPPTPPWSAEPPCLLLGTPDLRCHPGSSSPQLHLGLFLSQLHLSLLLAPPSIGSAGGHHSPGILLSCSNLLSAAGSPMVTSASSSATPSTKTPTLPSYLLFHLGIRSCLREGVGG